MRENPVIENILCPPLACARSGTSRSRARTWRPSSRAGSGLPSASNRQEWTFVVVDGRARIARLSAAVRRGAGPRRLRHVRPAAIVIVAHEKGARFVPRGRPAAAMQSMMLAAHQPGPGQRVAINQLQGICDEPAVRAELDALGVPATSEVHGVCALGHAVAPKGRPHDRKSRVVWA